MSIDFTTPSFRDPTAVDEVLSIEFLPLMVIKREPLNSLDVRDETGSALPVLTRDQNAPIASLLLQTAARSLRRKRVVSEIRELFDELVGNFPGVEAAAIGDEERSLRSQIALARFRFATRRTSLHDLWERPQMQRWLQELSDQFILFVRGDFEAGKRRVLKLSYETTLDQTWTSLGFSFPFRWLAFKLRKAVEALGLIPYSTGFATPSLFDAESYHVEVLAPDQLIVASAKLTRQSKSRETGEKIGPPRIVDEQRSRDRVHLYASGTTPSAAQDALLEAGEYEDAQVEISFALRMTLVAPVLALSGLTTGVLGGGLLLHYTHRTHPLADASAALIVAVPGLFAGWVAPGGHRLVQRLFKGLRLLVFFSALVSFLAAATLVVRLPAGWRSATWQGLAIASAVTTLIATLAFIRSWLCSPSASKGHQVEVFWASVASAAVALALGLSAFPVWETWLAFAVVVLVAMLIGGRRSLRGWENEP